jgi:hypothetical protein
MLQLLQPDAEPPAREMQFRAAMEKLVGFRQAVSHQRINSK